MHTVTHLLFIYTHTHTHTHTGFKIQPVHLGGMSESDGIIMLHTYSDLQKATPVTPDGKCVCVYVCISVFAYTYI